MRLAALGEIEHEPASVRRLAAEPRQPLSLLAGGPGAADVRDAAADDRLQLVLELGDRMAGQVQPERLALACEPHASLQSGSTSL